MRPGACTTRVQEPECLGHPPLSSQAINRESNGCWAAAPALCPLLVSPSLCSAPGYFQPECGWQWRTLGMQEWPSGTGPVLGQLLTHSGMHWFMCRHWTPSSPVMEAWAWGHLSPVPLLVGRQPHKLAGSRQACLPRRGWVPVTHTPLQALPWTSVAPAPPMPRQCSGWLTLLELCPSWGPRCVVETSSRTFQISGTRLSVQGPHLPGLAWP